ncbi:unnamed protein product [Phytomonas sp. EM1]|nr:unnamed protein product [Phytomonas sp. EM1]|eukprot:CCW65478.1 unnamed protein product [Phytomonas sp. isolate EM1]
MLIKDLCPFKKTLYLPTRDFRSLLSSPFQINASVETVKGKCVKVSYMIMEIPLFASIIGIELRMIELLLSDGFKGCSTVFLQNLDGQGRPCSEPFALYSAKDGLISNCQLRIPLQGGEKVQLLFVCDNTLNKNITPTIYISGVCMLVPGRVKLSKTDGTKLNKWTSNRWVFQTSESSFIPSDGYKSNVLVPKSRKRDRSSSDEPPQLIHAFVMGGDDES